MSQTKQASKRKRKALSVSVLSVAGMSLVATTRIEAGMPSPGTAPVQAFLGEEEISDISLATFHLAGQEIPEHRGPYSTSPEGDADAATDAADAATDAADLAMDALGRGCGFGGLVADAADSVADADASDSDVSDSAWVGGAEAAAAAGSADGRLAVRDAAPGS